MPGPLLAALAAQRDAGRTAALLVHLSTDQVYGGADARSTEAAGVAPVNTYGASKVEAEAAIAAAWPPYVALRSSIIYGPQTPVPVARPLFVQFIVRARRSQCPRGVCVTRIALNSQRAAGARIPWRCVYVHLQL